MFPGQWGVPYHCALIVSTEVLGGSGQGRHGDCRIHGSRFLQSLEGIEYRWDRAALVPGNPFSAWGASLD